MKVLFRVDPPFQWVKYDGNKVESFGEVAHLSEIPLGEDIEHCIGVVDADWVSIHTVEVPAKTKKQMAVAVPFALEENLVDDIDDLHFSIIDWVAGKSATVAVVTKEKMQKIIDDVRAASIDLDQLLPETLVLPIHEASNHTLAVTHTVDGEPKILARSRHQAAITLDEDLLESWLKTIDEDDRGIGVNTEELTQSIMDSFPDMDARHWAIGDRMAYWLEQNPDLSSDLLGDEFLPVQRTKGSNDFKWAAVLVGLALVLKLIFDGYEYVTLWNEDRVLSTKMVSVIQEVFPEVTNVIPTKERFMMQQQMDRLEGNSSTLGQFQDIVAAVAWARIQTKLDIQVSDMRFKSGELVFTCLLKDFSQVDKLTKSFNSNDKIISELASSSSEGGKVSARYRLKPRA